MSFWNRLASAVDQTYQNVTLPMGLEWTFAKNLKDTQSVTAAVQATKNGPIERPIVPALNALNVPYHYATHSVVTAQAMNPWEHGWTAWGDPDKWKQAWNETQSISPGQSQIISAQQFGARITGTQAPLSYAPER